MAQFAFRYDATWSTAAFHEDSGDATGGWTQAVPAMFVTEAGQSPVPADKALGQMSLLTMQPMAVTETRRPANRTKIVISGKATSACTAPATSLGGEVPEGSTLSLACVGTTVITSVDVALFGVLNNTAGRFVGGTVAGKCVDPTYPPGCIFWQNFKTNTKHFVRNCLTAPCGINACSAFVQIGAAVSALLDGPDFDCSMATCSGLQPASCEAPGAKSVVEKLCLGKSMCSVPATAATFSAQPCPDQSRQLAVVASGCAPAATVAWVSKRPWVAALN